MSVATKRIVATTRHEYILPSPASAEEFGKAANWAQSELHAAGQQRSAYVVEARDDKVVIWWEGAS